MVVWLVQVTLPPLELIPATQSTPASLTFWPQGYEHWPAVGGHEERRMLTLPFRMQETPEEKTKYSTGCSTFLEVVSFLENF